MVYLPDLYQYTNPKSPRGPLPAPRAWELGSEAGTVGPFQSASHSPGLFIEFQNAGSRISPPEEMLKWNDGFLFGNTEKPTWLSILHQVPTVEREKPKTELRAEWRKASGRSLQTGKEIDGEQSTGERKARMDQGKSFLHRPQSLHLQKEKGWQEKKNTCHTSFGGCSTTGCPSEIKSGDFSPVLTESHQQLLPCIDKNRNRQEADLCSSGETLSR